MNGGGGKAGNQSNVEEKRPGTSICNGTDRPSPTRKRAELAEEYDKGGRTTEPEPGRSRPIRTRVESARSEAEVYELQRLVGDQEREEPSTPILETSAVANQRKIEETVGGSEELETDAEGGSSAKARHTKHALR